ncbi:hypothetical protein AFM12_10610 [Jiulongibacter sediminis]|uniref:Uncharacterized protein n=1 Tax=Jiulongibacter sediminis TaxID=1605367 RepID=A0A0N8H9S5_9BACT|nr:hypothetical protein AFM12_10610 [Jiulongibacter sediminis]TBX24489.1 hypothetical protein TK44_10615 [Jiulongibacter sediminis]
MNLFFVLVRCKNRRFFGKAGFHTFLDWNDFYCSSAELFNKTTFKMVRFTKANVNLYSSLLYFYSS